VATHTISLDLWPSRSESAQGRVVAVHVSRGDTVRAGDVLVEVELDKAVIEVESPVDGIVVEVHVSPGDAVRPGDPLVTIETPG